MRAADPTLKFSDYAARYDTYGGVYETGLRTNTNSDTAQEVLYDVNRFKDGRVTYTTASTGEALGGYSAFGNTTEGNELTLTGVTGTLTTAYGGQTAGAMGDSVNNKVTLNGTGAGSIANVYGGAITKAANNGDVTGNAVTLTGGKVMGKIYGGYTAGNGKTTGNTVNFGADPTTLRQGDASTLAAGTNFAAAELYGGLSAKGAVTGNTLVLAGGTLTTDEKIAGEVTGTQGVSLDYKFRVQKKGADELIAAVESVEMKGATKSLAETRTTATDVLGGGMTMLADVGVSAAVEAAAAANANARVEAAPMATNKAPSAKAASAANVQSGAYTAWAAQGGSSMRIHSGSYVDTHGYTLNVGFARKQEGKDSTLTFGPFVEYGRASYDSYLEDAAGTHGNGKVSYIGAGVLARQDLKSGLYLEGSVRGGRIKSDYEGNISGTSTSYDISNPYYAIHLGVGKETKLKAGDAFETYLKYFFSHQNGTSGKLSTGEDYDFDAVNSHRLRLGARYTHDMGEEGKFYAGLAWEYEFNGEARATYQGMATPSPSLKGGSAMLELGYRFTPKKSRVSYDVNFSGWQGKREGFSGSVGVNWAF